MDILRLLCHQIYRGRVLLRPLIILLLLFCALPVSAADPQRIVSIAPSFTEILYALGAGPQVVATTLYCDYPKEANATEKIGDVLNPNVEKIISLKPDLVFCGDWKWNVPDKLRAAGIEVVEVQDAHTLDQVADRFLLIGEKIHRKEQAKELVDRMKADFAAMRSQKPAKPKTAFIELDAGNWTVGGASYLTEILDLLGVKNVFADRTEPYLTVTMESIVARDPDILLSLNRTSGEYEKLSGWSALRPVKSGHVIDKNSVDWNTITHQGSRLMEGIRALQMKIDQLENANR